MTILSWLTPSTQTFIAHSRARILGWVPGGNLWHQVAATQVDVEVGRPVNMSSYCQIGRFCSHPGFRLLSQTSLAVVPPALCSVLGQFELFWHVLDLEGTVLRKLSASFMWEPRVRGRKARNICNAQAVFKQTYYPSFSCPQHEVLPGTLRRQGSQSEICEQIHVHTSHHVSTGGFYAASGG